MVTNWQGLNLLLVLNLILRLTSNILRLIKQDNILLLILLNKLIAVKLVGPVLLALRMK